MHDRPQTTRHPDSASRQRQKLEEAAALDRKLEQERLAAEAEAVAKRARKVAEENAKAQKAARLSRPPLDRSWLVPLLLACFFVRMFSQA